MSTPSIKLNSIIERVEAILKEADVAGVLCLYDNESVPGSNDGVGVAAIAEFLSPSFSGIQKTNSKLKDEFIDSVMKNHQTKNFSPEVKATLQMLSSMSQLLAQSSLKVGERSAILSLATGVTPLFKKPDEKSGTTNNN